RHTRGAFHELRAFPNTRSFMFDDVDWEECQNIPALRPTCGLLRVAIRSGDSEVCARTGDAEPVCRAYMGLDPALCRAQANLKGTTTDYECRKRSESAKALPPGLQALAEPGPQPQREFAKAALGRADACAPYLQTAIQACMAAGPRPPG